MANSNRYSPFGDLMSLRDAMNTMFEDSLALSSASRGQAISMPLDISETQNSFTIEAALPGVKPEDVDISFQDNVLTISGEVRQQQTNTEKANYHRVERRYGRFARSISLPTQIQADAIQAHLEHGVLRLEVPKAEAVKPRKITVNTGRTLDANTIEVNNGQTKEVGA